ncbi:MAG: hypothetical protein FWG68_09525 [Defluviitaleaceae bacterium]|nr:hypothetical protein [Defluviitaleaceae bacterium]
MQKGENLFAFFVSKYAGQGLLWKYWDGQIGMGKRATEDGRPYKTLTARFIMVYLSQITHLKILFRFAALSLFG